mgnify:CR=1 FL=1|jgi:hypothetical protein
MDSKTYSIQLEKKLIEQFKETFYEKIGYYPTVITRVQTDLDQYIPMMSLETLQGFFEPFLPTRYQRRLKLQSKDRYRELVELRNIYCFLARQLSYSLVNIGASLGKRDHTTVIHSITCFKNLLETDEGFRQKYITILTYIKEHYESPTMDSTDQVQREPQSALLP